MTITLPWLAVLAALATYPPADGQPPPVSMSMHEYEKLRHADVTPTSPPVTVHFKDGTSIAHSRIVYGYYTYWADSDVPIPWASLTHLAYFDVGIEPDGSLGNAHSWDGSRGATIIADGHAHGVQVVLCVTNFTPSELTTLLSSAVNRQNAIDNLLAIVQDAGGDGVNIDFERVPATQKDNLTTFMTDLAQTFHTAIPGSHVTLATPAVDWSGAFDYDQLALNTDGMMIMGYAYHWAGGNPGPCAPLESGDWWSSRSLTWTVEDYITNGGAENRHKFILGLPFYGFSWPTTDSTVPCRNACTKTDDGSAVVYGACQTRFATHGKDWDNEAQAPYRAYQSSGWVQLYCEDIQSLQRKLDLVVEHDLGGVGIWTLAYEGVDHHQAVWQEFSERFDVVVGNNRPIADAGPDMNADTGQLVILDGSGSHDADTDTLGYWWWQHYGPDVELQVAHTVSPRFTPDEAGTYIFKLIVQDYELTSVADSVTVTVWQSNDDGAPPDGGPFSDGGTVTGDHDQSMGDAAGSDGPAITGGDGDSGGPGCECGATGGGNLPWLALLGLVWLVFLGKKTTIRPV